MRTTVTLEEDLFRALKQSAHERDVSFKTAINEAIRSGLRGERRRGKPYRIQARDMGLRPGVDLTKANQLAAELEDAELIRKLRQGR